MYENVVTRGVGREHTRTDSDDKGKEDSDEFSLLHALGQVIGGGDEGQVESGGFRLFAEGRRRQPVHISDKMKGVHASPMVQHHLSACRAPLPIQETPNK
jgi:hypothetical protein